MRGGGHVRGSDARTCPCQCAELGCRAQETRPGVRPLDVSAFARTRRRRDPRSPAARDARGANHPFGAEGRNRQVPISGESVGSTHLPFRKELQEMDLVTKLQKRLAKEQSGFTLIELLVVLVIIGILLAIAV